MIQRLLSIEKIKTIYSPTFRGVIILHAVLFLIVALVASSIRLNIQGVYLEKVFHFPHIWNTLAWIASWFNLLLGILAIILVTNEFNFRTFRKQLIDGLSRNEILMSKVLVFALIAIYAMVLVFGAGFLFGILKSPSFSIENFTEGIKYIPILFLQSLGYMLVAMLFAFIFRSTAISTISFILYFFPIEPIIRSIIPNLAVKYMPAKVIANLTPMPDFVGISLGDLVDVIPNGGNEFYSIGLVGKPMPLLISSLVVIGYCFLFILVSKFIVDRKNF